MQQKSNDPLHGKTLEAVINALVAHFGWAELGYRIRINCFLDNPSVNSSLKFLRKTPWARKKVEDLYISAYKDMPGTEV
jgi:uncharacterized protein (DUF2132 family)